MSCNYKIYQFFQILPVVILPSIQNCGNSNVILRHFTKTPYFIGGLFTTHVKEGSSYVLYEGNIQLVSSMMLAIQEINESNDILPGIKLGYEIRDTNFEILCSCNHALDFLLEKNQSSVLVGVLGPGSSFLSVAVNTMLLSDFVPHVSYASTSISLSKRSVYRNFFRTIPTDNYQANAIIDLIDKLQWTYISLFTSDDEYGRFGRDEILKAAKDKNICFSVDQNFDPNLSDDKVSVILDAIEQNSRIVVIWSEPSIGSKIVLKAIARGLTNVTWIGTESWILVVQQFHDKNNTHNIIFLQLKDYSITALNKDNFSANEKSQINCENPWFKELLRKYAANDSVCITSLAAALPKGYISQVYSAVYALAYGLHNYLNCSFEKCFTSSGLLDYELLYKHIINTQFIVPNSNYSVKFDKNGEFLYPAYQYMFVDQKDLINFGTWEYNPNNVLINEDIIVWKNNIKPKSVCSLNCNPGTYRVNSTLSKCCWICVKCPYGSISSSVNQYSCTKCSLMSLENSDQTQCNKMSEINLNVFSTSGIIIIFGSSLGVFCTSVVLILIFKYRNNPIIRSSNKEMSCIQVFSLQLLFCISFIYFWKPTPSFCVLRTSLFGILLATVLSVVTIKTYRLLRIFNSRFKKASQFLDNKFQITLTFSIVSLQALVIIVWNIYNPTNVQIVPNSLKNMFHYVCDNEKMVVWISLSYCFVLAIASWCMAFRARKLPENYKETQIIVYAMFTVCILWFSYFPIYFSVDPHIATLAFLSINILSCFSLLIILYGKKTKRIWRNPRIKSVNFFYNSSADKVLHTYVEKVVQKDGPTIDVVRNVVMYNKTAHSETIF
ncbi:extracellular calcium-sensing receptor [Hydra vulgaris]|uniref:extracellular calcium-sensing receptor n=1 Tax=Hydra vulgaris TaxID=6087 RepID=UPI001F5EB025|nr:extracellular calcium-sensing receptor-like [Hydra vulgaris]